MVHKIVDVGESLGQETANKLVDWYAERLHLVVEPGIRPVLDLVQGGFCGKLSRHNRCDCAFRHERSGWEDGVVATVTCCRRLRGFGRRCVRYPQADACGYMLTRHSPRCSSKFTSN